MERLCVGAPADNCKWAPSQQPAQMPRKEDAFFDIQPIKPLSDSLLGFLIAVTPETQGKITSLNSVNPQNQER